MFNCNKKGSYKISLAFLEDFLVIYIHIFKSDKKDQLKKNMSIPMS